MRSRERRVARGGRLRGFDGGPRRGRGRHEHWPAAHRLVPAASHLQPHLGDVAAGLGRVPRHCVRPVAVVRRPRLGAHGLGAGDRRASRAGHARQVHDEGVAARRACAAVCVASLDGERGGHARHGAAQAHQFALRRIRHRLGRHFYGERAAWRRLAPDAHRQLCGATCVESLRSVLGHVRPRAPGCTRGRNGDRAGCLASGDRIHALVMRLRLVRHAQHVDCHLHSRLALSSAVLVAAAVPRQHLKGGCHPHHWV
mmetsp:Transcript_15658/g.53453  ORF Transcript_15658/g.53453 Transcript_15658/m.53453 type:complete len:256 (+) Transcript_15658:1552-2319(+)